MLARLKKTQGLQIFSIITPPSQTGGGSGQGFKFKSWQGRERSALEESERSKSEIFDRWSKRKSRADGPEAGITEAATKFCTSVKLCRGRCAVPPLVIFNLPGFLLLLLLTHRFNFQEPASELTRRFCATARSEIWERTKVPFWNLFSIEKEPMPRNSLSIQYLFGLLVQPALFVFFCGS